MEKRDTVNDFCPDGYVPLQEAMFRAAKSWFPEQMAALETAAAPESQPKADGNLDAVARAFSQPLVLDARWLALEEVVSLTVHRLRNLLHQGTLNAYYFGSDGSHRISREFWAAANADGMIETGIYWPFGKPTRSLQSLPNYSLFLPQSELDALLSEQPTKKRPFPGSKMPELVATLRTLDHLSRSEQREALRRLPEFEQYHLTDEVLREAEKQVPRKAGRKPLRPEQ